MRRDRSIIIAGASGLVGGLLLERLGRDGLVAVGRRRIDHNVEQRIGPLAEWPSLVAEGAAAIAVSTLGTTMRKAGSREAFAAIDHDVVAGFATAAKAAGARQFMMVSAIGADARSSNFYLRTKGRAEDLVAALDFARLDIFRPGLLLGERGGDRRPGERLAILLSPLTNALTPRAFDRYRASGQRCGRGDGEPGGCGIAWRSFSRQRRNVARAAGGCRHRIEHAIRHDTQTWARCCHSAIRALSGVG